MRYQVTAKDYILRLQAKSNEALSLGLILSPFKIQVKQEEAPSFLVLGQFLEAILEEYDDSDLLDPLDIASTAFGLGLSEAGTFLDKGPELIFERLIGSDSIPKSF